MKYSFRAMPVLAFVLLVLTALLFAGCAGRMVQDTNAPVASGRVEFPAPPAPAPSPDYTAGIQLVKQACGQCHSVTRVFLQPDTTDWPAVIDRMIKVNRATLDGKALMPEQIKQMVTALSGRVETAGEMVVKRRCTACHSVSKIGALPSNTDWFAVIGRMTNSHNVILSSEDQKVALEFLKAEMGK
jgi:cytochrome c5